MGSGWRVQGCGKCSQSSLIFGQRSSESSEVRDGRKLEEVGDSFGCDSKENNHPWKLRRTTFGEGGVWLKGVGVQVMATYIVEGRYNYIFLSPRICGMGRRKHISCFMNVNLPCVCCDESLLSGCIQESFQLLSVAMWKSQMLGEWAEASEDRKVRAEGCNFPLPESLNLDSTSARSSMSAEALNQRMWRLRQGANVAGWSLC